MSCIIDTWRRYLCVYYTAHYRKIHVNSLQSWNDTQNLGHIAWYHGTNSWAIGQRSAKDDIFNYVDLLNGDTCSKKLLESLQHWWSTALSGEELWILDCGQESKLKKVLKDAQGDFSLWSKCSLYRSIIILNPPQTERSSYRNIPYLWTTKWYT